MSPSTKYGPWHRALCPLLEVGTLLDRPSISTVLVEHENGMGTQYRKVTDE